MNRRELRRVERRWAGWRVAHPDEATVLWFIGMAIAVAGGLGLAVRLFFALAPF